MPKLVLKFNQAVIKEYPIKKPVVTVGRKPDNDIVVDNPAVSSHHCKISLVGEAFYVEDLDSTNGTYLNDKRIVKAGLKNEDVVGLATKHMLVFIDEKPVMAKKEDGPAIEPTIMITPKQAEEVRTGGINANAGGGLGPVGAPVAEKIGTIRVLKGVVDKVDHELSGISTYIGNSDRVQIRIKGGGFFSAAPEVAASIHRRPEGYFLVAVNAFYPVVNGSKVSGQLQLKDGDIIECGSTTMQFFMRRPGEGASA